MFQLLNDLDDFLDAQFASHPKGDEIFSGMATFTHLGKRTIAKSLITCFAAYMTFGHFAQLICNGVGFIYPAIQSLEALETPDIEDDRKWLTYWVVFAFFSVIEFYSDKIFHVFPVYFLAKLCFLIWCFWPTANNGSIRIYKKIIRPYYLKKRDSASSIEGTNPPVQSKVRLSKSSIDEARDGSKMSLRLQGSDTASIKSSKSVPDAVNEDDEDD